jgi:hypothetical protein
MDELLQLLYVPDANLYKENYCHLPQQGMEQLEQSASEFEFPWEQSSGQQQ